MVDKATGKVITGPEIHAKGFAEDDSVFDAVKPKIAAALAEAAAATACATRTRSRRSCAASVGRWVNVTFRRRPMIVPLVIEA